MATLSLTVASCDFCSSDRRFASAFLQIPLALIIVVAMKRTPLVLAVSFPLLGRIRDFHPLETCAARRTTKNGRLSPLKAYRFCIFCLYVIQFLYCDNFFQQIHMMFLFPLRCFFFLFQHTDQALPVISKMHNHGTSSSNRIAF